MYSKTNSLFSIAKIIAIGITIGIDIGLYGVLGTVVRGGPINNFK